jgi:hypothetical protein
LDASDVTPGDTKDLGISSSSEGRSQDSGIQERQKNSVLSTEHTHRECVGEQARSLELDELRDQVAKLTGDDNLAEVFRDQIADWMTSGMTAADVRQAILIARSNSVQPRSYVAFVTTTAGNVRDRRLTAERQARALPEAAFALAPAAFPARPTKSQRNAAASEARRASMARHFPKGAPDGSR